MTAYDIGFADGQRAAWRWLFIGFLMGVATWFGYVTGAYLWATGYKIGGWL